MHNLKNSAAVTKIKALYGKKISKQQLKDLSNCKNVSAIASYLKNQTNYNKFLKEIDENSIHRGELEILIKKQNFYNYEKILHYFDLNSDTIFKIILSEFEVLEILKIILFLKTDNTKEYISYLPGYLISKCKIDLLKLAKIQNFSDLLNVLNKTWYYNILKKIQPTDFEDNASIDYITCEHLILEQFFKQIFKIINKKMNRLEMLQLKKLIELEIYFKNVCNIFREKIIFNLSVDQIKKHILLLNKVLINEKIQNLIQAKDIDDFKLILSNFFKKSFIDFKIFNNKNNYIENYFNKLKSRIFKHLLYLSNDISIVFYTFHKLTQIEISNLICTIEGVRYGLSPKEIQFLQVV